MAGLGSVGSGPVPRETDSLESSATPRTPVPSGCSASPESPVPPGKAAEPPGKSLWEQICEEYEGELPPFPEEYKIKPETVITVSPIEETIFHGFKAEHLYSDPHLTMNSHMPCTQVKSETVNPKTCSPKEYLETFIFPILLPGIASLLHQTKKEKCFERKRTKFIACDFLTEWLYNQNSKRTGEPFTEFFSIPFVEQWLRKHPRPPIPLSLQLTEEEAALCIQSFWRAYLKQRQAILWDENAVSYKKIQNNPSQRTGHMLCARHHMPNFASITSFPPYTDPTEQVRCDPEIQELRQWQKKLREEKHIRERVKVFWAKQEEKVKYKMEEEEEEEEEEAKTPAP